MLFGALLELAEAKPGDVLDRLGVASAMEQMRVSVADLFTPPSPDITEEAALYVGAISSQQAWGIGEHRTSTVERSGEGQSERTETEESECKLCKECRE